VHRDIKPGNLMVRPDGVVKLTDFGIAQARDATPLTRTGMVVGTAQYLSPEQAQGMEVTAASDVYSLGVVAYECLAGVRPFDGASQVAIALAHINRPPPPLPAHVPPAVRLLVERALAKDPADRFPDGGAFAEAIRRVAAGGSLSAAGPATAPVPAVGDPVADGRTQVFGAATGAAVAAAGLAGAAAGASGANPPTGPAGPMPPLQAPDDADDWGPDGEEPPADRRRRAIWIAAAAVVLLLLAGGAWFLFGPAGDGGNAADRTSAATSTDASASVIAIDLAAYLGRDADEVQAELEGLGFTVSQEDASEATVAEGTELAGRPLESGQVADINPSGDNVPTSATVTIYAVPEAATSAPEETTAEQTTTEETTTSAPTTTSEAPTTSSEAPPTTTEETTTTSELPASTTTETSTSTPAGDTAVEGADTDEAG
jgi:serine/threonine-protein kinase